MKLPKEAKLTHKEKLEILRKWNNWQVGIGEINYVEWYIWQKIESYRKYP